MGASAESIKQAVDRERCEIEAECGRVAAEIDRIAHQIPPRAPAQAAAESSAGAGEVAAPPADIVAGAEALAQFIANATLIELGAVVRNLLDPLVDWYCELTQGSRPKPPENLEQCRELYAQLVAGITAHFTEGSL
jgi:hypothetical protein